MTMGKFLVRWLVVFILADGLGFLIHAFLLRPTYTTLMQTNPGIMRPDADAAGYMLWLQLAYRFGFAVWVISSVYRYLVYYFVQPWPGMVIAKQIGFEFVACLLIGVVLAGMSKNDVVATKSR